LLSLLLLEEPKEEREEPVSADANEKVEELELEERELQRDCSEILDKGDVERSGMTGNWVAIGVVQVGAAIASLSLSKISSSSLSSSRTCCAKVLREGTAFQIMKIWFW
jgi:hypothetical protein